MTYRSLLSRICLLLVLCFTYGGVKAQQQAFNFSESFEGEDFPPSGWTVNCNASGLDGWSRDDGTTFGPGSVNDGNFAAMADMYNMPAGKKASLITPVLDFSGMTNPVVKFDWHAKPGDDPQPLMKIFLSKDGGASFSETVFHYSADGFTRNWKTEYVFLDNPGDNVKLKFEVTSDYGSYNVFLDHLVIEETPEQACADISVPGMSFDVVQLGQELEYGLYLRNLGSNDLVLESLDIAAPFSLKEDLPITLIKGERTVLNFVFAPTEKGPFQQNVQFNFQGETTGEKELILNGVGVPQEYEYEGFEEELLDVWEIQPIVNNPWKLDNYGIEGERQIAIGSKFQNAEHYSSSSRLVTPELETKDGDYLIFYAYKVCADEGTILEIQYLDETTGEYVKFKNVPLTQYPTLYAYDLTDLPVEHAKIGFYAVTQDAYDGIGIDALRYPKLYLGENPPAPAELTAPENYASDLSRYVNLKWERESKARGYFLYIGEDTNPELPVVGEELPEGWEDMLKETSKSFVLDYQKTYRWMVVPYNENGISDNNELYTFTVANDPTVDVYPYFQGFEKAAPPHGWENIDGYWYQNGKPNSGLHGAGTSSSHKGPAIMSTPKFITGDDELRVSFFWKDDGIGETVDQLGKSKSRVQGLDTTYFEVTKDNGINWEILDICVGKTSGYTKEYSKVQHNLADYKNQTIQFRFRDVNWQSGNSYGVSVDDFIVEVAPTTPLAEVNIDAWNYGEVAVNKSEDCPFTFVLKNDGPGSLTVSEIRGLDGTCFSTNLNPADVNLAYWEEKEFVITAAPTAGGNQMATMEIDCGEGGVQRIDLRVKGNPMEAVTGDFENALEFSDDIAPFISIDKDKYENTLIQDCYFKTQEQKIGFFTFNPKNTFPPVDDQKIYRAHSGDKFMAAVCVNSPDPNNPRHNNDWLILPNVDVKNGDHFNFWAKSLVGHYGFERVRVLVGEGDPYATDDYVKIHDEDFFGIPDDAWNPLTFDLSAYAGKRVNVAIQCASVDAFILMIDDVMIESATGVQETFDSENTLSVYPNPANNLLNFASSDYLVIKIYDANGQLKLEQLVQKGESGAIDTSSFVDGPYFVHYTSKHRTSVKKVIINH